MKNLILRVALIVLFFTTLIPFSIQAQPFMGGEVTWECKANGKFVFHAKLYRECTSVTFPSYLTLSSNSPLSAVVLNLKSGYPKEISPVCNPDTSFDHIACINSLAVSLTGAVQVYSYASSEMQLVGVPPATGWYFYYSSMQRNPSSNLTNSNSLGWCLRAFMYPYNNQNTFPCFDSSPDFVEPPTTVMGVGYANSINNNALDLNIDSLSYEWCPPWKDLNSPLSSYYKPGHSYDSPFPDTSKHINNKEAVVNSETGVVDFKTYNYGAYITCMKVSSYRNGVKTAEVYRDYQYVLSNKVVANLPPVMATTLPMNSNYYTDTVFVGETVSFNISAADFQLHSNGNAQNLTLSATSPHFGSYVSATATGLQSTLSETTGCLYPPCAKLTPAPSTNYPFTATYGIQTAFEWNPDCSHLLSPSGINKYDFFVSVKDDFCPVPAERLMHVRIVVLEKIITNNPPANLSYVYIGSVPKVVLQWSTSPVDSSSFLAYYIYEAASLNGTTVLIDSVLNYSQTLYDLDNSNVFNQDSYYSIRTRFNQPCAGPALSTATAELPILISDMEDVEEESHLLVLPNPTAGKFEIETSVLSDVQANLRIVNIEGKVILEEFYKLKRGEVRIPVDISSNKNGIYFYELEMNGDKKSGKVLLNK